MKAKIALVTFSISQSISPLDPQSLRIIKSYGDKAEDLLKNAGFEIVRVEKNIDSLKNVKEAINLINREKPDSVIFLIGVWPSTSFAIDIAESLNRKIPVILWAVDDMNILSLVPSCQFHGAFDDMAIKHEFIYANPEEKDFLAIIKKITTASKAVVELAGSNLGLFGGRYMYMYTGTADPVQVKKVFGIEITHIDEFCLVNEAKKIDEIKVAEYSKYLHKTYGKISAPAEVENRSIRLYIAMEKMKRDYELDFASVKCMLEVQGEYCSHCLSVAKHIDNGFIISCEGDINGAITMQILKHISGGPAGFGDICRVDKISKIITVINCGTFATEFAKSPKDVNFPEQKKDLVPGDGTGMTTSFVCKPGEITISRLGRINGEYVMQIGTGEALNSKEFKRTSDIMPHLFARLNTADAEDFIQNCRSNHLHWVYGNFKEELIFVCKILNIKPILF